MLVNSPAELKRLEGQLPWYCESRPKQIKRIGITPRSPWAVGPTPEGRVRWLFANRNDWHDFKMMHWRLILIAGNLGPLHTETRSFK